MKCEWPVITRCCCCLPLRQGLIAIGYVKFIYSAFMVGAYSFVINKEIKSTTLFLHGAADRVATELCLVLYLVELVTCAVMLYGAHMKVTCYLRIYFYYGLMSSLVIILAVAIQFLISQFSVLEVIGFGAFCAGGFFTQMYLMAIIWNLMEKIKETEGQRDNPLQRFISGTP